MMRIPTAATLVALATFGVTPAATAPPVHHFARADWLGNVAATPEGGYRLGNPAARVRLVEYGSLTCPHCRAFNAEAMAALRSRYIATGRVSFEFRNYVLNGPDYAASLLVRCGGARQFFPLVDALYAQQEIWVKPFLAMDPATNARLATLEPKAQIAALAKAGGLGDWFIAHGVAAARIAPCLADDAAFKALAALRETALTTYKIDGTPGFLIDGKRQTDEILGQERGILTWDRLEPRLVAALRTAPGPGKAVRGN